MIRKRLFVEETHPGGSYEEVVIEKFRLDDDIAATKKKLGIRH